MSIYENNVKPVLKGVVKTMTGRFITVKSGALRIGRINACE